MLMIKRGWMVLGLGWLAGCGWLSNDVFFDGFGHVSGQLLLDGQPADGALVFVLDEQGVWDKAVTDAQGAFRVGARAGRQRRLVALWGDAAGLQRHFELTVDAELELGAVDLEAIGVLTGSVDLGGVDPRLAEVQLLGSDWFARPDAQGRFGLQAPAGTWSLEVRAPGFFPERREDFSIQPGVSTALELIQPRVDADQRCEAGLAVTDHFLQSGSGAVDVLFVVDNSRSMVGEQLALARSFSNFVDQLTEGLVDFRLAVVTTGVESPGCGACPPGDPNYFSCINETGESGRFQDRRGHNLGTVEAPEFDFLSDPGCRIMGPDNLGCFFEAAAERGVALVGINGCGYERGLAAMRAALSSPLIAGPNAGFLRPHARLAVVLVSDEEDCGEVGDVTENIQGVSGNVCYWAAKGVAPDGAWVDPAGKALALTPVGDYADFLWGLKSWPGLVRFSAITGVSDPADPGATVITYESAAPDAAVLPACYTPYCVSASGFCEALPGTRYIRLAQQTGGVVETICQADFSWALSRIASATIGYRTQFPLSLPPRSAQAIAVWVEGLLAEGWSYDQDRQVVTFPAGQAPSIWSAVEIEYTADCP